MLPIETERLVLRDFAREDIVNFSNYRKDPEIAKYQSWSNYSLHEGLIFYQNQEGLTFNTEATWYQIGIFEKGEDQLIGDIAVHFFEKSQVEIGFTLSQGAQKKGYAREAIAAILDLLFGELDKHRIVATIDTRNLDAKNLLEALNFRQEGHHIKNVFFKGEWADEYRYALLKDETIL